MTLNRLTLIGFLGGDADDQDDQERIAVHRLLERNEDIMEERGRHVGI